MLAWHSIDVVTRLHPGPPTTEEQGFCSAAEWSERLGAEIVAAQQRGDPDDGSTYYQHVLATVEGLVRDKDLLSADALLARRADWEAAYRRTPHGQPVVLSTPGAPEGG